MSAVLASARDFVPKPGIYHDLPIEVYHGGGHGISKSGLDDIARCPAAYHALHLNPDRPREEDKAGQLEGNLAHCAILEPQHFATRYHVGPDVSRATKEWKAFVADLPRGVVGIKPDQRDAAIAQAASVRRLPELRTLLSSGDPEVSAYWIDDNTGVLCRCRPDWVHPVGADAVILVDVKTYSDASPAEFRRQVARKRYHVQDGWYSDGFEKASGKRVLGFVFAAVETSWPYLSNAMALDDDGRDLGRTLAARDLATYARCVETGVWPAYGEQIATINLPRRAFSEIA